MENGIKQKKIFVSYSRVHKDLVNTLLRMIGTGDAEVLNDVKILSPGMDWSAELSTAIENSQLFILFWCDHASQSKEVKKEYLHALEKSKPIYPVILDNTMLPETLERFERDDLSEYLAHWHTQKVSKPTSRFKQKLISWTLQIFASLVFIIATLPMLGDSSGTLSSLSKYFELDILSNRFIRIISLGLSIFLLFLGRLMVIRRERLSDAPTKKQVSKVSHELLASSLIKKSLANRLSKLQD